MGWSKPITPDRGKEFSNHFAVTEALNNMPFYFPDPHAPWQRGTNENTNGLIREYLPKSNEMDTVDDSTINQMVEKLVLLQSFKINNQHSVLTAF
ncbi:IS30 family transposase [Enterococcus gallinarum]|uniref:IS30 family transposase n=1 Tax=Enterococcus gallinarum TaxID=1353 RepID=UPI0024340986|nr:IS30 family transposase [Enterococcus gallinarum]